MVELQPEFVMCDEMRECSYRLGMVELQQEADAERKRQAALPLGHG